jgi:hypothetical protein
LILSFWNDSIFYLFLGPFPHLVGWVEPEGEGERGERRERKRVPEEEGGRDRRVVAGKSQSKISNPKS